MAARFPTARIVNFFIFTPCLVILHRENLLHLRVRGLLAPAIPKSLPLHGLSALETEKLPLSRVFPDPIGRLKRKQQHKNQYS
jgi:hypothetical protein